MPCEQTTRYTVISIITSLRDFRCAKTKSCCDCFSQLTSVFRIRKCTYLVLTVSFGCFRNPVFNDTYWNCIKCDLVMCIISVIIHNKRKILLEKSSHGCRPLVLYCIYITLLHLLIWAFSLPISQAPTPPSSS